MSTKDDHSWLETTKLRWEPRIERWRRSWDRFSEHRLGIVGLFILMVYILWALFPSVFAPHSPEWVAYLGTEPGRMTLEQSESLPHPPAFGDPFFAPLGTNSDGAGIATLVIYSARNALYIGFAAGILSSLVGVPLGLISGFYGNTWIDELIQRVADIGQALPFLPLVIVLVAMRGINVTNIIIAIVFKSWINNCIVIRGETLSLKERSYVESAEVAGASDARIVFRHILPNVIPLGFIYLAADAATAILTQANLAFLGLADFTANSWGLMLQRIQSRNHVFDAPWWLIPPGLAIMTIGAAFYYVSYSMEDVANPQRSLDQ
jgi:peptide/nickel transport system permease protein